MLLKNTEPEKKMKVKLLGLLLVFAGVLYW